MYSNLQRMIERTEIMRRQEGVLRGVFDAWAYHEVAVPVLTDHELFRQQKPLPSSSMYKMIDADGEVLVLRPDMTAPVAQMAAEQWRHVPRPLRLSYFGEVFRRRINGRGARTIPQAGVELLGAGEPESDAEMMAMAADALESLGVRQFQINLGHNGLLAELSEVLDLSSAESAELRTALADHDLVSARRLIEGRSHSQLTEPLLRIFAPGEAADHLSLLEELGRSLCGLAHLQRIFSATIDLGLRKNVQVDVSLAGDFAYYTGAIFEVYCPVTGARLGGGGRYDELLGSLGSPEPATGFALDLQELSRVPLSSESDAVKQRQMCLVVAAESRRQRANQRAEELRAEGYRAVVQILCGAVDEGEVHSWAHTRGFDAFCVLDGTRDGETLIEVCHDGSWSG